MKVILSFLIFLFHSKVKLVNCAVVDGCEQVPRDLNVNFSSTCVFNIKECAPTVCTRCHPTLEKCCSPTITRKALVMCLTPPLEVNVVVACGCKVCQPATAFIMGRVMSNSSVALADIAVKFGGNVVGRTDSNGDFSVSVPFPSNDRIPLMFVDDMNNMYFMATKVVHTIPGIQLYTIAITMFPKGAGTTFTSSAGGTLRNMPTASITVAPNSITNADGTPYDGPVTAFSQVIDTSTADPTVAPDLFIAAAPGSGDPNPTPLNSFGILQLAFEDSMGNRLQASGVTISIDASVLGGNAALIDRLKIWSYDTNSGLWVEVADMTLNASGRRRRKRQIAGTVSGQIDVDTIDRIYNLDALWIFPYCYMKIRTYRSNMYTNQLNGPRVTAVYRMVGGSWTNNIELTSFNGVCMYIPCNGDIVDKVVVSSDLNGFLLTPSNFSEQLVPASLLNTLNFTITGPQFVLTLPPSSSGISIINDTHGPIYSLSGRLCFSANSLASNHFRLYSSQQGDIEINTCPINEEDIFRPFKDSVFSWWPNRNLFKACYIKVAFQKLNATPCPQNFSGECLFETPTARVLDQPVRVYSNGTSNATRNFLYGTRQSFTVGNSTHAAACIEYKCPDILSNGVFDRTWLRVETFDFNFFISSVNPNLQNVNQTNMNAAFLAPLIYDGTKGVYQANSTMHPRIAKMKARGFCFAGSQTQESMVMDPLTGIAIYLAPQRRGQATGK